MHFAGALSRDDIAVVYLAATQRRLGAALVAVVVAVGLSSEIRGDEKPVDSQDEDVTVDVGAESASHSELDALPVEFEKLTALCWNVDGNLLAMEIPEARGEAVNVACGGQITVNAVIRAINESLGTNVASRHLDARPGDVRHSCAEIRLARKLLGFEPSVSFEDGLSRAIDFYRTLA